MKWIPIQKYFRRPLLLFLIFLLSGLVAENYVLNGGIRKKDIQRFSTTFHQKEKRLDKLMTSAATKLATLPENFDQPLFELLKDINELFEHREMSIVVTQNGKTVYWSDHVVGFMNEIKLAPEGLMLLPNGWFVLSRKTVGNYVVHGLVLIKYDYKIENNYLTNRFSKGFHLPDDFQVLFYKSDDTYPIYNQNQKFIFSLKPSGTLPCIYSDLYYPMVLFFLALLFLFLLLYRTITHYFHHYDRWKIFGLLLFLLLLYTVINYLKIPRAIFMLNIFTPKYFAYSGFLPSLGNLLLFSSFMFFWSINFFRVFHLPEFWKKTSFTRRISVTFWLVIIGFLFLLFHQFMQILVMNSSVSYAIYQIEELNFYSLFGFLSLGFLLFALVLFSFRLIQIYRKNLNVWEYMIILLFVTILLLGVMKFLSIDGIFHISLFYFAIMTIAFFMSQKGIFGHRLTVIIMFVFSFTLFCLFSIIGFVQKHETHLQELMAINLSEEHDPTVELYLRDIDAKIKTDTFIIQNLDLPFESMNDYIVRRYFGGYFREYDLQITICDETDSLIIHPQNQLFACFPFFDIRFDENGVEIPDINFRYIENMNGRITYMGKYEFESGQKINRLYIELNSKLLSEGTGFPELLLPQHSIENRIRNHFSFAKYNEGELVDRGGDFLYALTSNAYQLNNSELEFRSWDGYLHCIYKKGTSTFIVVSRPNVNFYDYLISFPYLFVFFFLMAMVLNYTAKPYRNFTYTGNSLRIRIQLAIIGVVLFTLLIIGGGTIYFNIMQYQTNHRQDLIDKINSISIEMDILMDQIESIEEQNMEYIQHELVRISDIFWSDINLYNLKGELLATSRPEVFDKGLISPRMDNTAIHFLSQYQPTRFLHREHIGKMEYLSAYVPLIDQIGRNVGYINLPYFTHERKFRQQITTFILAFINIYVFLLMGSILVAYYISARITDPLKLIREHLRNMQLGKSTKPIEYNSDDEIGVLVKEYNNKVAELAESAEMLARTEREMAWREMAKQIAHEIKNPLTPMKLNIQFLQRTNLEKREDYDALVKRVTSTLIEQIDNLSAIATEFSNFAKMPTARNEQFNLVEKMKETINLYSNTGQFELETHFEKCKHVMVYADKEQFSRAIINLIKNAVQAIPESKEGKIIVKLEKENKSAIVSISDNGKGIDETLRESIFVPNFTTKSSGAGLGLAITKNIVQNFKGEIWYESVVGEGTTFFIRIPIIK